MKNETERPQDELRTTPIVLWGVISAIVLVALTVGLSALFLHLEREETEKKRSGTAPASLRMNRSRQLDLINGYRWIDEKNGVVQIEIERAMELVVEEAGR